MYKSGIEVLEDMIELYDRCGYEWTTHAYSVDINGQGCDVMSPEAMSFCIQGAAYRVCEVEPHKANLFLDSHESIFERRERFASAERAMRILQEYLGEPLSAWNDKDNDKNKAFVVREINKAIEYEKNKD